MSSSSIIVSEIKKECLRRINDEGIFRINKCLDVLDENQVWHKPNQNTNSVGNLILHLIGNVNQWVLSTLGDKADTRNRNKEFEKGNECPLLELKSKLEQLKTELIQTINTLTEEALQKTYKVQCYEETGVSIVIHAIEHFSYHVGQITLQVKLYENIDLKYYDGQDLTKTN